MVKRVYISEKQQPIQLTQSSILADKYDLAKITDCHDACYLVLNCKRNVFFFRKCTYGFAFCFC